MAVAVAPSTTHPTEQGAPVCPVLLVAVEVRTTPQAQLGLAGARPRAMQAALRAAPIVNTSLAAAAAQVARVILEPQPLMEWAAPELYRASLALIRPTQPVAVVAQIKVLLVPVFQASVVVVERLAPARGVRARLTPEAVVAEVVIKVIRALAAQGVPA